MVAGPTPQQLPVPDNFRFRWETPEEAAEFWTADLMHWPHGLSPLTGSMDVPPFGRGLAKAAEALAMPFKAPRFKVINHYLYNLFSPYSHDPAVMEQRMAEMQGRMWNLIPGLLDRWRTEFEPEVRSINDDTLKANYAQLGDKDLADLFERLVWKREREGELHFLAVFPAFAAVMVFEEVYTQLFGAPEGQEHYQLLGGFQNKTVESAVGLWHLAGEARRRPQVMEALQKLAPSQVHAALDAAEGGPAFKNAVREWCATYGWRAAELDIAFPTWYEDPAPVYSLLREYTSRDDYDPEAEFKSLVSAREAREKLLLDKLPGEQQRGFFEQMLRGAQQYLPVQEDHNFWIDQQGLCVERVPALEAGRRLAAQGRIERAEDVFYVHYDELLDTLRSGKGDLMENVRERRRSWQEFRKVTPPPAVGTPPPPEALEQENPIVTKFFGAPPPQHPDPRIINGNAASAGICTGTARVILSLDDADRLRNGEILVCPATMPPWTPLFGVASAVVTDHGGVLSHTAIVAREYAIPAVVGTKVGTALIRDGQTITVDGTAGTVKLEA